MLFEQVDKMQAALDGFAVKHQAIANNLANVNTPGFQRTEVSFAQVLDELFDDDASPQAAEGGYLMKRSATADLSTGFTQASFQFDEAWARLGPMQTPGVAEAIEGKPDMKQLMAQTPGVMRLDGNGVSVEKEVGEMVKNSMMYNLFSQKASGTIKTLKDIIQAR